ncbi:hypothetical protein ACHAWF_016714 [Thalassiosira exigua]
MFSWSKPGPPSTPSSPSSSGGGHSSSISRSVHLSSYLDHRILKPSTRKVSSDRPRTFVVADVYDTVFQTTNGFALIARVYLPADGGRAPAMTLHGVRASHDWLDIRMKVIGYGPLSSDQRWRASGLKLGDAVYAVIHHFQLSPPSILEITDANLKRLQESLPGASSRPSGPASGSSGPASSPFPKSASSGLSRPNESNHGGNSRPSHPPPQYEAVEEKLNFEVSDFDIDALMPAVPASFLEIDNMSLSELKQMVEDKAILASFVENTSGIKTLKELKRSIETANVTAAEANLAHRERIEGVHTETLTLKRDLDEKLKRYRELDAERMAITHPPDLQEAIRELTIAKKDAYRTSEELADEWVESGGDDVSGFIKDFMEARVLYHTRAAKAERLEMSM